MEELTSALEAVLRGFDELEALGPWLAAVVIVAFLLQPMVEAALWIVAAAGAGLGLVLLAETLRSATGAPQEAAGPAIACACAILPYVVARAWRELTREPARGFRALVWKALSLPHRASRMERKEPPTRSPTRRMP